MRPKIILILFGFRLASNRHSPSLSRAERQRKSKCCRRILPVRRTTGVGSLLPHASFAEKKGVRGASRRLEPSTEGGSYTPLRAEVLKAILPSLRSYASANVKLFYGMRSPRWFSRSLLVQPIVLTYFHGSPTAEPVLCRQYQGFSSTDMSSHGGAELPPHSDG
jgi:hypothetical protein